jgi:hypothetical protein
MKQTGRCGACESVRRHLPTPIANGLRRLEDHIRKTTPPGVSPAGIPTARCMHEVPLDAPCQRCVDMLQATVRTRRP